MIGAGGVLVVVEISVEDKAQNDADLAKLDEIFVKINALMNRDLTEKEQGQKEGLLADAAKVKINLMMREQKQKRLEKAAIDE